MLTAVPSSLRTRTQQHHGSPHTDIVKASSGPRYVVGVRTKVDQSKLTAGTRVSLDMTTLTIMRALPREVSGSGCVLHGCARRDEGQWGQAHGA